MRNILPRAPFFPIDRSAKATKRKMRNDTDQKLMHKPVHPLQNRKRDSRMLFTIPYFFVRSSRSKVRSLALACHFVIGFKCTEGGGFIAAGSWDKESGFLSPSKPSASPKIQCRWDSNVKQKLGQDGHIWRSFTRRSYWKKIRGHVVCYKAVLVSSRTRVPVKSFLRFVKQSDIIYTFDTVS